MPMLRILTIAWPAFIDGSAISVYSKFPGSVQTSAFIQQFKCNFLKHLPKLCRGVHNLRPHESAAPWYDWISLIKEKQQPGLSLKAWSFCFPAEFLRLSP